ncbi:MAG TPA: SDR family NAD(P)-dependent oxidoreductase, partial [Casimicrobiaceae bacterium]
MTTTPFDLSGKVALVTGAYRGLGFAIAQGLARAGATVVLNGRKQEALDQAATSLTAQKLKVTTAVFDVTDCEAIDKNVAAIVAQHGSIDILFNNAGIQRRGAFVDFPQDQWDEIIATNLTAPFIVSQAVVPGMIAKKQGKIVHIASLMSDLARPTV